ncbi:dUTPase [Paenibacillus anaericanus]|uniref:dUTPase n=1 Tax=Paenibacillus anaericanus TaxID=170367 RepID=A0A433YFA5_9BACL|nr:dUTP diphosphatase [Paenibacillus anaericanus]RUT48550.1 dUTPase [Paenibacillus anaericanus]
MTLKLEQMYEMQKALDAKIIKEKGLEGQNLLPNTILALQVEIAELANEWRGFKHWSNDREPRTAIPSLVKTSGIDIALEDGTYLQNPLLEEYVDCLHFFLSIARQLEYSADDLCVFEDYVEGETGLLFTELLINVGYLLGDKLQIRESEKDFKAWQKQHFRGAIYIFYALGEQRLGFDFEDIAAAYAAKNEVNHERQANGY